MPGRLSANMSSFLVAGVNMNAAPGSFAPPSHTIIRESSRAVDPIHTSSLLSADWSAFLQLGLGRIEPHDLVAVVGVIDSERFAVVIELEIGDVPVGVFVDDLAHLARRVAELAQGHALFALFEHVAFVAAADDSQHVHSSSWSSSPSRPTILKLSLAVRRYHTASLALMSSPMRTVPLSSANHSHVRARSLDLLGVFIAGSVERKRATSGSEKMSARIGQQQVFAAGSTNSTSSPSMPSRLGPT